MSARSRDLLSASLIGAGIMGAGELFFACRASTLAMGSYWKDWFDREKYFSGSNAILTAHGSMASLRNDVLLVSADASIVSTTSILWTNNECHMVGMFPAGGGRGGRARISQSGNFTPLMAASGYGCLFHNMHFMYGAGSTANENIIINTGTRNIYTNCHIACYNATELLGASFSMVQLSEELGDIEVTFNKCFFGSESLKSSGPGCHIEYAGNSTIKAFYNDCNFVMQASSASAVFIRVAAGAGKGTSIFKNTTFINNSSTKCTVGIASSGLVNTGHQFYFDANSYFAGVTDVCNEAEESYVMFAPAAHVASTIGELDSVYTGHAMPVTHTSG